MAEGKYPLRSRGYIVYKHEDIDRHHIHIVSLRVDEQGRKIDDRFEHRRSKDITRALEQKYGLKPAEKQQRPDAFSVKKVDCKAGDVKKQISNVIKHAATRYHYLTFNEYRALLSLYNVSAEEVKGEVKGKPYNGVVYSATNDKGDKVGNPFKSSLFGKSVGYEALQKKFEGSKEAIKEGRFAPQTKRRAIGIPNFIRTRGWEIKFLNFNYYGSKTLRQAVQGTRGQIKHSTWQH